MVPCSCEFGVVLPLQTGSSWQDRQCVFRQLQGTSLGDKSPYLTRIQMEPSTGSSASMHLSQSCAGKVCDNCRLGLACRLYTVKIMLPHFRLINVHYTIILLDICQSNSMQRVLLTLIIQRSGNADYVPIKNHPSSASTKMEVTLEKLHSLNLTGYNFIELY